VNNTRERPIPVAPAYSKKIQGYEELSSSEGSLLFWQARDRPVVGAGGYCGISVIRTYLEYWILLFWPKGQVAEPPLPKFLVKAQPGRAWLET
jgi:hypothetical protein